MQEYDKNTQNFLNRLEKQPEEIQVLVMNLLQNARNAGNWGFLRNDRPETSEMLSQLKKLDYVDIYEIKGGHIFRLPLEKLFTILGEVAPEIYSNKEKELALEFRQRSLHQFKLFLESGVRSAKIGIYGLNDSPNISIKGKFYKSFNFELQMALLLMKEYGYDIKIGGRILPVETALLEGRFPIVLKHLELAPSKKGLMMDIVKRPKNKKKGGQK